MFCQAFRLPFVEKVLVKRQGHDFCWIYAPEIGDFKDAIGQLFYASPSPDPKKPITAALHSEKSLIVIDSTLPMGMAARRLM